MIIPGGTLATHARYFEPATVTVHVPHSPFLHFVGTFNPNLVHAAINDEPGSASTLFPLATHGVLALNNAVTEAFLVAVRKLWTHAVASNRTTSSNIVLRGDVFELIRKYLPVLSSSLSSRHSAAGTKITYLKYVPLFRCIVSNHLSIRDSSI